MILLRVLYVELLQMHTSQGSRWCFSHQSPRIRHEQDSFPRPDSPDTVRCLNGRGAFNSSQTLASRRMRCTSCCSRCSRNSTRKLARSQASSNRRYLFYLSISHNTVESGYPSCTLIPGPCMENRAGQGGKVDSSETVRQTYRPNCMETNIPIQSLDLSLQGEA